MNQQVLVFQKACPNPVKQSDNDISLTKIAQLRIEYVITNFPIVFNAFNCYHGFSEFS